jgi:alanine or glycine:cation symporter, AGCS family
MRLRFWVVGLCLCAILSVGQVEAGQEPEPAVTATAAPTEAPATEAPSAPKEASKPLLARFNGKMFELLFFDVAFGAIEVDATTFDGTPVVGGDGQIEKKTIPLPFLVLVLIAGAIFFTLWFRFINIRGFVHAIQVVRGKYDNPDDEGEISHFRALTSALSATIGLGNIAGVAVAIVTGGPGAVVWMMIAALFGMTAKFSECTLSQMFRKVNPDGSVSGGPMYYLDLGLKEKGKVFAGIGKVLAVTYAVMVMGGALGGGNMFQANQTVEALTATFKWQVTTDSGATIASPTASWIIGIVMAVFVGAVILGGIKRIGAATSRIVPLMVGIYVVAALVVLSVHAAQLPAAVATMFSLAFTKNAFYGGVAGVLVKGVQRAAFSNEAGIGSASIAHAAAKTDEPVREGLVALLEPFIDTIVVCFMTAMVVIVTDQWNAPGVVNNPAVQGASVTAAAFATVITWFPVVLSASIALFAYSTMVSWCYYGERGWIYLLDHFGGAGLKSVVVFRLIFVIAVVVGSVNKLGDVLDFSDIMILSMAFPNVVGMVILAPRVLAKLDDYWKRHSSGAMLTHDEKRQRKAT